MGRRLALTVYLTGDDGSPVVLLAGSEPSEEQAALIVNPKAWEAGEGTQVVAAAVPDSEPRVPLTPSDADRPPTHGPGSSKAAWTAYAAKLGVPVAGTDDRDDIIAAVDDRG